MQLCPYCENCEKQIKSGKNRCGTQAVSGIAGIVAGGRVLFVTEMMR